jgi:hypothetical protein
MTCISLRTRKSAGSNAAGRINVSNQLARPAFRHREQSRTIRAELLDRITRRPAVAVSNTITDGTARNSEISEQSATTIIVTTVTEVTRQQNSASSSGLRRTGPRDSFGWGRRTSPTVAAVLTSRRKPGALRVFLSRQNGFIFVVRVQLVVCRLAAVYNRRFLRTTKKFNVREHCACLIWVASSSSPHR